MKSAAAPSGAQEADTFCEALEALPLLPQCTTAIAGKAQNKPAECGARPFTYVPTVPAGKAEGKSVGYGAKSSSEATAQIGVDSTHLFTTEGGGTFRCTGF